MIIKYIGALLIIISSSAIGFRLSSDLELRIEELSILKKMALMLRGEIKYTSTPLFEAFSIIGNRIKSPYKEFLLETAKELEELNGTSFTSIWEKMKKKHLEKTKLYDKDLDRLINLGENLGYLDKEMQIGTIELYLEQLEQETIEAKNNLVKNSRLYQCLGVASGILITILIL